MTMPESVRKQAEKAQELQEGITKKGNPEEPAPGKAEFQVPEPGKAAEPLPTNEQRGDVPARAESTPDNWEVRFKNYKTATDRTIHELRQVNSDLQRRVESLQAQPQAQQPANSIGLDELKELFGDEGVDAIVRLTNGEVSKATSPLKAEIDRLNTQLHEEKAATAAHTEHQSLTQAVANHVKDWERIDSDSAFLAWMNEPDDYSPGATRADLFLAAKDRRDVGTIVRYYLAWKAKNQPKPDPRERMITPESRAGDFSGQQGNEKIWTQKQITDFYAAKRRGDYRGKEDEATKIERDIFAAQRENRIAA